MADIKLFNSSLKGKITVCPSKSIAHRAIILGALSGRDFTIKNVAYSKDIEATVECLKALGMDLTFENNSVIIKKSKIKKESPFFLNAIESGSTLRFLIPVCVALGCETVFTGEGRLPERPLDDYLKIFDDQNIFYEKEDKYLPLKIKGPFKNTEFFIKGNVSSQFITGLMLMSSICDEEITINITTELESKPYVDITKKIMEDFGHSVSVFENVIKVKKGQVNIDSYTVENDWSQAAFFLAAGAICGEVTVSDMNLDSKQGDIRMVDILEKMGADVTKGDDFVSVKQSQLSGVDIDVSEIPDLVPILSVVGACAKGETLIYNAKRLRLKESDRLYAVSEMLNGSKVKVSAGEDFLKIIGTDNFSDSVVDSFNDHRIIMAASIMALKTSETVIKGCQAVKKSYPEFFKDYFKLGGKGEFLNE